MEFIGLVGLAIAVLFGLLTLSDSVKTVGKQMRRTNDLKEAELRSRGITVAEPEAEA
jgi:hypothetical protein